MSTPLMKRATAHMQPLAIAGLGTGNWSLLWALAGIALGALVQGLRAKA